MGIKSQNDQFLAYLAGKNEQLLDIFMNHFEIDIDPVSGWKRDIAIDKEFTDYTEEDKKDFLAIFADYKSDNLLNMDQKY